MGAACAVSVGGQLVVDLWAGSRDPSRGLPWQEDTLVNMFSTTKGVSSIAVAHARSRGLLDYDQPVATYWPEFAVEGKAAVTVRQLLSHQAGLCAIDAPLTLALLADPDAVAAAIASQKPAGQPGDRHGYHGISLGWYESELVRRADPGHRTIGRYFADEIAAPLGLDFHIGLPDDIPTDRVAVLQAARYTARMPLNVRNLPFPFVRGFLNPRSLTARTFANPKVLGQPARYNDRAMMRIELPASNGIGTARSVALAYGDLAVGSPRSGSARPPSRHSPSRRRTPGWAGLTRSCAWSLGSPSATANLGPASGSAPPPPSAHRGQVAPSASPTLSSGSASATP